MPLLFEELLKFITHRRIFDRLQYIIMMVALKCLIQSIYTTKLPASYSVLTTYSRAIHNFLHLGGAMSLAEAEKKAPWNCSLQGGLEPGMLPPGNFDNFRCSLPENEASLSC